jgi:conjugative transfer region protein TrbK
MIGRRKPGAAARLAAMALVGLAIAATALRLGHPGADPAAVPSLSPAAVEADPVRAELIRCQTLGEAGARDAACLRAWAENRRRFLDGIAPAAKPMPKDG